LSKDRIFFVGHVMIDNLFHQVEKLRHMDSSALASSKIKKRYHDYGVVTLHRPSNVDNKGTLERIIGALAEKIGKDIPLIFPVHPRMKANLEKFNIRLPGSLIPTQSLPYMAFLNLFIGAKVVLTDSGGVQEETTALGVPCVTLRENTERPITLSEGYKHTCRHLAGKNRITDEKYSSRPGQEGQETGVVGRQSFREDREYIGR
jgi:UDP-N-acetylglucosamine 2-epimerase (non-hydrolysing)